MALLVDAFNVMHADERLAALLRARGPEAAIRAFTDTVRRWVDARPGARGATSSVVLVFDGQRPPGPLAGADPPGLERVFMADRADAELMRRLRKGPGRHVLVSADAEVVAVAEATGSETRAPRAFLRELLDDLADEELRGEREPELTAGEVARWAALFRDAVEQPRVPPRRKKKK